MRPTKAHLHMRSRMCVSKRKFFFPSFHFHDNGSSPPRIDTGVTCNAAPPELTPLHIVPGGVTGQEATYYRVPEFLVRPLLLPLWGGRLASTVNCRVAWSKDSRHHDQWRCQGARCDWLCAHRNAIAIRVSFLCNSRTTSFKLFTLP